MKNATHPRGVPVCRCTVHRGRRLANTGIPDGTQSGCDMEHKHLLAAFAALSTTHLQVTFTGHRCHAEPDNTIAADVMLYGIAGYVAAQMAKGDTRHVTIYMDHHKGSEGLDSEWMRDNIMRFESPLLDIDKMVIQNALQHRCLRLETHT